MTPSPFPNRALALLRAGKPACGIWLSLGSTALVAELARCGGTCQLASRPGHGTTMTLTLPAGARP